MGCLWKASLITVRNRPANSLLQGRHELNSSANFRIEWTLGRGWLKRKQGSNLCFNASGFMSEEYPLIGSFLLFPLLSPKIYLLIVIWPQWTEKTRHLGPCLGRILLPGTQMRLPSESLEIILHVSGQNLAVLSCWFSLCSLPLRLMLCLRVFQRRRAFARNVFASFLRSCCR